MKTWLTIFVFCGAASLQAQEIPTATEQQLENLADVTETETEDDSYWQSMEYYRKHPVNLNTANETELKELRMLNGLQVSNFMTYRRLLGKIISLYELQAIPSWDVVTIRKLLPFVTIHSPLTKDDFLKRFKGGEHIFLLRVSQVLERSAGFDTSSSGNKYLGSPQRVFVRYRYNYKNILQYGITGDKDAGEQFFKGAQQKGFDFYSFHLFARRIGIIHSLAIGDFTVNMGQGLVQWQSLAFKKSSVVMNSKRQSGVLRPYNSAGEFNFHRGIGVTVRKNKIEATLFSSLRKLSANIVADTIDNYDYVSSLLSSGYNRTAAENADRNKLTQTAFGGNINYRNGRLQIGLNGVYYRFSLPLQKRNEPYNLYSISGNNWANISVDYSYTYKNMHFFGEAALDKNFNKAFVNGILISADPKVDISFLHRSINTAYQSVNGNAFTENVSPTNENGFYAGVSIRPVAALRLDAYADVFRFPWLKFRADAPGKGTDFLVQLTYTPTKQVELYARYRNETKQANQTGNSTVTNFLVELPRQNFRLHINYKISHSLVLRNRAELLWYDKKGENAESGFLAYADVLYKPVLARYSAIVRLQYFETDGYNSRVYAYENDVLYSYSIPAFFDKGLRYYCTAGYDFTDKLSFWLRLSQSVYRDKTVIGSGPDAIKGPKKTEVKIQLRLIL